MVGVLLSCEESFFFVLSRCLTTTQKSIELFTRHTLDGGQRRMDLYAKQLVKTSSDILKTHIAVYILHTWKSFIFISFHCWCQPNGRWEMYIICVYCCSECMRVSMCVLWVWCIQYTFIAWYTWYTRTHTHTHGIYSRRRVVFFFSRSLHPFFGWILLIWFCELVLCLYSLCRVAVFINDMYTCICVCA